MNSYKLKDLIKIHNGTKYSHLENGGIPLYGSGGLMGYVNNHLFDGEAILLPRKGTLTNIMYVNEKFWSVDTMYYATTNNNTDSYYLYSYLSLLNLECLDSGSALPSMTKSAYNEIKINLPDYNIQKKVGSFLKIFDTKIELNNRISAELEKMAKTLYDYWFVQFDFPDENGKPYKSSGGKMVFDEKLKREIPEGWEVENLKNNSLTKLLKPKIDKFENKKIYLATADVQNQDINFQAEKITFEKRPSRANMQPIENSIWFAKMKNSKKVLSLADYSTEFIGKFILSTGFAGLKCKEISLEYIWGFINNDRFDFIKDRLANGATQEAINNDTMVFINLMIPSNEVLEKYHLKIKSLYQKIYNNQIENQKLAELRDWLLPMLMNEQVVVE